MDYRDSHRALQDAFDTRRLADRLASVAGDDVSGFREFIEARDMFFIATSDADGQPQSSYKGGDPGFVRVVDDHTIAFPVYDGNGMFLTIGNVTENHLVGLLFIDFANGSRLRVNGEASVDPDRPAGRRLPGRQARRTGPRAGGLPQLPSLRPHPRPGRAVGVRARRGRAAAGAGLEARRVVRRHPARRRPGARRGQPERPSVPRF